MRLLSIFVLILTMQIGPATAADDIEPRPDPSLSPEKVVRIQLEALKTNDVPHRDRGIEVTFQFASPNNKNITGPLERFAVMVHGTVYRPMINHRSAEYENLEINGDAAQVDVIIRSERNEFVGYRFSLSRQRGNQYEGSWMTDSVVRFDVTAL